MFKVIVSSFIEDIFTEHLTYDKIIEH
jgi:hypothetical protein